MKHGTYSLAL